MKTPDQHYSTLSLPEGRPIPPHLRVGSLATYNLIDDVGVRRFIWQPTEADEKMVLLAGWGRYVDAVNSTSDRGCLILPNDTRAASAALSGMRAFSNEKEEIVKFLGDYAKNVHDTFGGVDGGLGLDTLGVTRGNREMFALPPHDLQTKPEQMRQWVEGVDRDLAQILAQEEQRDQLIGMFAQATEFARGEA